MKKNHGFTLLEVIIAIAILTFISLITAQMIQQGVRSKTKIQTEIDRKSTLQSAIRLMSEDIQKAFHYRDINVELHNAAQQSRRTQNTNPNNSNNNNQNGQNNNPPLDPDEPDPNADPNDQRFQLKEVKVYSRFIGEKDRLDFTSLNNFRNTKNSKLSDQTEIGYYIDRCSSRIKKDITSDCLWRRVSPHIDEDVKEGGDAYVLIENVKSLEFRYLGEGSEQEWKETWMTEGGEEVTKDKFPFAVEITLIINDIKFSPPRELAMTVIAPLKFPNNKVDQKSNVVN